MSEEAGEYYTRPRMMTPVTKDDLRVLGAELRGEFRTGLADLKADLLKWAIGMQLSFAALILGAVYAMLSHWKP